MSNIMIITRYLILLFYIVTQAYLFAYSKPDNIFSTYNYAWYNNTVAQGEVAVLYIRINTTAPINVNITNAAAQSIITVPAFRYKTLLSNNLPVFIALIPIASTMQPDTYFAAITIDKKIQASAISFSISAFDFIHEKIQLNNTNTTILTKPTKKKTQEKNVLKTIFATYNPNHLYTTSFPLAHPIKHTIHFTSYFGDRRTYVYTNGKTRASIHNGLDYRGATGSPIYAINNAYVVLATERITTGGTIILELLPGLYSAYYHLSSIHVKTNTHVKPNEIIGQIGATGLATGPHLHWEIQLHTVAVNPQFFMNNNFLSPIVIHESFQ